MKAYVTPEMKALAFVAEEAIGFEGNLQGSKNINDAWFTDWD